MPVRIATDNTADLPRDLGCSLCITVVLSNLHFGQDTFRDGLSFFSLHHCKGSW
jgi:hypothetical protein